ncbi:Calx-beta domain-containing protein [Coleofasciculus sp. H7-2]|uniref:Calx-beta domain-containing protein n=1 Tax=Coleofasciculus sp. H7-2 TaxID=3351545 RepID=UPI00366B52A7
MQDLCNHSSDLNQQLNNSVYSLKNGDFYTAAISPIQASPNKEIVFIDETVENYQSLAAGVKPGTQVVILNPRQDGVTQITEVLKDCTNIKAIHIVSHGKEGTLQLGSSQLSADTLETYTHFLQQWKSALIPDADILLYGCNVASGAPGVAFVENLSQLMGANIAASNNLTGSVALGGDWNLEVKTGSIETPLAFDSSVMQEYTSVLEIFKFIGGSTFDSAYNYSGTTVGGLSGITYDAATNTYYAISDAKNDVNGAVRFYTLNIDLSSGSLGTINFTGVTTLKDSGGTPFAANISDTEGIALTSGGNAFISSEGIFSSTNAQPFINQFNLTTGNQNLSLSIPSPKFDVSADTTQGVRSNKAFESLTITPDQQVLFTATEVALEQDGLAPTGSAGSPSRILRYDLLTSNPGAEFLYNTDAGNGISELLALDNNTFLAIDRFVNPFSGGSLRLYQVSLQGATDISSFPTLPGSGITPVKKTLIADFQASNLPLGNFEGMTLGPTLPNGKRSLVLVSDNNFGAGFGIPTQFVSFEINSAPVLDNSGSPIITTINEDPTSNPGTLISSLITTSVTDLDTGDAKGIAVTAADNTNGTWQFSTNGGTWTAFTPSESAAQLLAADADTRIRFVPSADYNGTVTAGITFRAWDQTTGTNGGTANITTNGTGGLSSFSTAIETASITINPVNDAPTFTPGTNQVVTAGTGAQSVTGWATGFNPGPANESSQTLLGYQIVSNSAPGIFKVAPTINATGQLTYTPSPSLGSSATATIGVTVQDNGGTANGGADTSVIKFFDITVNPNIAPLNVVINEVAWMGTNADFNDEWIELYNPTANAIDLSGWTLTSGDGTPSITFQAGKIIPAGGYFLLERTDNTTVNSIPSDLIYTGSLGNASGETLTLKTPDGVVIDTANGNGGAWPAGANVTGTPTVRLTMERTNPLAADTDSNWHRNDGVTRNGTDVGGNPIYGTPKAANSVPVPPGVTVTPITDLTTTEAGVTATFTVKLNTIPIANVTIGLTSSDTTEGTLSTSSLIFTPNNWNTPQTVTITGVDDTIVDGNIAYSIITAATVSTDIKYNNINPADVAVVNNDNDTPIVNLTSIDANAGETGANTGTFRISRTGTFGDLIVYMTIDGSSSASASDYNLSGNSTLASSGTNVKIVIPNGSDFVDITLTPNDDTLYEGSETLQLKLTNGNYIIGSNNAATVTIADNDPIPSLTIGDFSLMEGNLGTTDATFTVTLSAASSLPVTVDYETADGTAKNLSDFTGINGTLTFSPGETTKTIKVAVQGDTLNEINENFFVNLKNPSNATIADNQGIGTINNDDAPPSISIDNVLVIEGVNGGTNYAIFNVNLSAISGQTVAVNYGTSDGTATTTNNDYTSVNGTLTFAPGETKQTISVPIVGDALNELNETFLVNLSNPSKATIVNNQGTGTIINDDNPPSITIGDTSILEGDSGTSNLTFIVKLSAASGQVVTVDYATADDKTTVGSDYIDTSGTVTFNPGETEKTITVQVKGDTLNEDNEGLFVNLKNASSNATVADNQALGIIINNDPVPSLAINDIPINEGDGGSTNATFTVTLSAASSKTVTVNYNTSDGTATTADGDYAIASPTPITFAPGETSKIITVAVNGDTKFEANETFNINLTAATNATIAKGTGVGTINNNDAIPSLTISDAIVTEGNSGTKLANFTVSLSNASALAIAVNYATANGSAIALNDYTNKAGTLNFAPGVTSQIITVPIIGDNVDEANETFFVNLSNPINAKIADSQAVGTILDDDTAGFTISPISNNTTEVGGTATFTVKLNSQPTAIVTLGLASSDTTEGSVSTPSLTFTPNNWNLAQTITVKGVDDVLVDGNIAYSIVTAPAISTDAKYNGLNPQDVVVANIDNDTAPLNVINGTSLSETLVGTSLDDRIIGFGGHDTIVGGLGKDRIYGDDGNDTLIGDLNSNVLAGGSMGMDDLIYGGTGSDRINGCGGNDTLYGEAGSDQIWGDGGDDRLYGGLGNDILTGGLGRDIFAVAKGEGTDTIRDFQIGQDYIGLVGGLKLNQVSIIQQGSNTSIIDSSTNQTLAILAGVNAGTFLSSAASTFVSI